jgi:nitronate monooxygenase
VRRTRFTDLLGCELPFQQAPMGGGLATPALACSVADAGGIGMLSSVRLPRAALEAAIEAVPAPLRARVGVNVIVPFLDPEGLELASASVGLVDFSYGPPDPGLVAAAHAGGARVSWQVGSPAAARAAADAGCDLVVAQGVEAGGHLEGRTSLPVLLGAVLDCVQIPVVAAGGIGTGREAAAVLGAGADGVRLGTRFLAAAEAAPHPEYLAALIAADGGDTERTSLFGAMWPGPPLAHRVLRSCVAAAEADDRDVIGSRDMLGTTIEIPRFAAPAPNTATTGAIAAMALYAGTSVSAVRRVQPAAEIVAELARDAEQALAARTPELSTAGR